jgi:hypothetical protein
MVMAGLHSACPWRPASSEAPSSRARPEKEVMPIHSSASATAAGASTTSVGPGVTSATSRPRTAARQAWSASAASSSPARSGP